MHSKCTKILTNEFKMLEEEEDNLANELEQAGSVINIQSPIHFFGEDSSTLPNNNNKDATNLVESMEEPIINRHLNRIIEPASVKETFGMYFSGVNDMEVSFTEEDIEEDEEENNKDFEDVNISLEERLQQQNKKQEDGEILRKNDDILIKLEDRKSIELQRAESELGVPRSYVIWKPDSSAKYCSKCQRFFTFFLRRHHCRSCGWIFCDACSSRFFTLPEIIVITFFYYYFLLYLSIINLK